MNAQVYKLSHGELDGVSGGLPTVSLGHPQNEPHLPVITPIVPIPIPPVSPFPVTRSVGFER
jgi:hypothetical protein